MTSRYVLELSGIPHIRRLRGVAGLSLALLLAGPSVAQVLPIGDDFQVNTGTTGYQFYPQIAAQPDGAFVVAWCCGSTANGGTVAGQRFGSDGATIGPEMVLSTLDPRRTGGLASDAEGNFVVVWGQGYSGPGSGEPSEIYARRFEADGSPLGGEFVVNTDPGGEYTGTGDVAVRPDGSFVVVFENYGGFGQRYDTSGSPLGGNFAVAPAPELGEDPVVAARASGGTIVVWEELGPDPRLRGQRFAADGSRTGSPFTVAGPTAPGGNASVAAQPDGSFVVAWTSGNFQTGGFDVRARRFSANGEPLAPSFVVHQQQTGSQYDPDLAVDESGGFVVAWTDTGLDATTFWEVFARRFDADGRPLGGEFQVNSYTSGAQRHASLRPIVGDELVVVWDSSESAGPDTSGASVQGRRFLLPFFIDGFESGDTSAWSSASP